MKKPQIALLVLVAIVVIGGILYAKNSQSPATNAVPTPIASKDTETTLTPDEEKQILAASNEIVTANTEKGYTYTLAIKKHVGEYVRVDVTPGAGEMIDPAQVILEKKDGIWKALMFGTSFPDMYDKVPALFE